VAEVRRKTGISQATSFRWKQLYGGLRPSEVRKLRQLEEEHTRLRKMAADLRCCRRSSAANYDACSGT
jgi:putative transposase